MVLWLALGWLLWLAAGGWLSSRDVLLQTTPPATETPAPLSPYQVIEVINQARVAYGLQALMIDPILMSVAQATAEIMAANQMQGHIGDVRGRVMAAGYGGGDAAWATENFVVLPPGANAMDILQAWADDEHMIPVVNPNYQHIGAGVAIAPDGMVYYVLQAAYTSHGWYRPNPTRRPGTPSPTVDTVSQIIYPVRTVTPQPDGRLIHVVQQGQTLWSIAVAYGVHIADLQRLNYYPDDYFTVYVGQRLVIPTRAMVSMRVTETPAVQPGVTATVLQVTPDLAPVEHMTFTLTSPQPTAESGSTLSALNPAKAIAIVVILIAAAALVLTIGLWKK